jgi:TatD DNase family protein
VKAVYFDSHVHFDAMAGDAADIVARAAAKGVSRFLAVGGSPAANAAALDMASRFPEQVRAAAGYDRECAGRECSPKELETLLAAPTVVAVGEIGLDFHHQPGTAAQQETLFRHMLAMARRHRLSVAVHSRDAEEATWQLLREHAADWKGPPDRIGVLHCFTGSAAFARRLLDLGFHISFSGIITFRNARDLRDVTRMVPEDRLLVETDSPLLAPAPFRGRPNEPALLPLVAQALAEIRGCAVEQIARVTTDNAARLFTRNDSSEEFDRMVLPRFPRDFLLSRRSVPG